MIQPVVGVFIIAVLLFAWGEIKRLGALNRFHEGLYEMERVKLRKYMGYK